MIVQDNTMNLINGTKQTANIFLRLMCDELIATSTPNTPKRLGNLRNDIVKQVLALNAKVIWGKNYAIYQEVKQYKNYTTPGTGPHYAENAARTLPDKTQKVAQQAGLI